ncbi:phage antirepressor KilAC domain-containing protein [Paraburkholderia aspalathi]|uniref:phage antirepressor KilAC domain-containing protein n=1 Tax=Paraburkholderia aspalathi TaxID=1324617 RepID=UPI0038B87A2C
MNLIPFKFDKHRVRTIVDDGGAPLFVARDVALVLGYERPADAIRAHCKGSVKRRLPTSGGAQDMTLIPERDVYRLVMRSKLPAAEAFEEWVVAEVLPQIRRTGAYNGVLPGDLPAALRLAAELAEKGLAAQEQLSIQAPKVQAFERLAGAGGACCLTDAAKSLKLPRKVLIAWLHDNRWIYRRTGSATWVAYDSALQSRTLVQRSTTVRRDDGSAKAVSQVLVTPKGLAKLAETFERDVTVKNCSGEVEKC